MYNKGLFHKWVPKPVMLLLMIVLMIPVLSINGVYTGNIQDMVGGLGTMSETIMLAYNATAIGMATVYPFILRAKRYFRTKELMVGSLLIMTILSMILGTTEDPVVLVIGSFFIGFFKMFAMFELMIPIMFIISPNGDRGRFYSFFYPISIGVGQLSAYLASQYAYNMQWQNVYIVSAVILLFCVLLCIVFMHNLRGGKQVPVKGFDWLSLPLFGGAFMFLNYALAFAKQQAWMASPSIRWSFVAFVVLLIAFLYRQSTHPSPNLPLSVFKKKNVIHGILLTFLIGIYMSTGSLQSAFTTGVLGYDNLTNAKLNLAMIPGVVLGGIVSFYWFKRDWPMRIFVLLGFSAFIAHILVMYFLIAPVIDIEYLIVPMFLKGFGMTVLFISLGFYTLNKLTIPQILAAASVLIVVRSFLSTAVFSSVFSWALYKLQWQHAANIAVSMDTIAPFVQARGGGLALYGTLQIQAVLTAVKSLFGYIAIGSIGVFAYVILHRYGKMHHRRMVLASKWLGGESIKGYRRHGRKQIKDEVAGTTAAAI